MESILTFNVENQMITRTDEFQPVSDSVNYLYAHFEFLTDEWVGTPSAIFTNNETSYEVILDSTNTCLVPHEVLATEDPYVLVSVFVGDRVTANTAKVFITKSGWSEDLESSHDPTPSVYAQLLAKIDELEEKMQNIDGGLFTDWTSGEGE